MNTLTPLDTNDHSPKYEQFNDWAKWTDALAEWTLRQPLNPVFLSLVFDVVEFQAKRLAAVPAQDERAEELVAKLRDARTAWHESFGVPISQRYANFLEAIGDLCDFVESRAARASSTQK